MDKLTFISKVLEYSLWPIVSLIIVFLLRGKLFTLVDSISKFKAKDFELEFTQRIKDIEKIQETSIKDVVPNEKIMAIANEDPTLAIVEAWKVVEIELTEHAKRILGTGKDYIDLIREVSFHNLLGYQKMRVIDKMQELRNDVVHSSTIRLTKEDAINYAKNCTLIIEDFKRIKDFPKIKLTMLTILILEVNHLIDTGKYNNISIEDVENEILKETLIQYLANISQGDSDFSPFISSGVYNEYVKRFNKELKGLCEVSAGEERRKWGIEKTGLCLVIAWTNEIIQRGTGWNPTLFEDGKS
jgi:hypothetical protein